MKNTALINARLFDGSGRPALFPATLLIEGSVCKAAGLTRDIALPEGCRIIDVQGKTILPGLIDAHMHVTGMPGTQNATARLQDQLRASELLKECLAWGTTTVGHAGGCEENLILRNMINQGKLKGRSRLLVSGVVTATGGHVRGEGADGPWEIRKMARRMALAGFDFYKTCATGGFQWAHEGLGNPDYTLEELQALVAEAHMRGRRVHVHAHAQPGIQNAVESACDVILHGTYIDAPALKGIADRGLIYMPTLYVTSEHFWGNGSLPEHIAARTKAAYQSHRHGAAQAHALGITIATGTDGKPGAVLHELCELVNCGLTTQEAIMAATRHAAKALGVDERLGTLEPGKLADCIVVNGDPLANISVLTAPEAFAMVVKEGNVEIDRLATAGT